MDDGPDGSGALVAGRYQIIRSIGRGGMGEVLLARQLNLNRLVVIKRVIEEHSNQHIEALLDEARNAARLHHPNIVSVLDVSELDEAPFIAMELVIGVSLREMIDRTRGGLVPPIALTIIADVLRGLAYAHGVRQGTHVGMVHRDIKPRNVMVTFAGVTKLIDFGISRWLSESGALDATSASGTVHYMAPEQHQRQRVDGRADQYSAGVTLREMLTAISPHDERSEAQARAIDPDLSAIVDRATQDRPDDRYPDCTAMLAAIENHASTHAIVLSPTQVEHWLGQQFAGRSEAIERDAQVATGARRRPPTVPTILEGEQPGTREERSRLLGAASRVAFVIRNLGEPADAWLGPVIERLVRRHFRHADDRRFFVVSGHDRDIALRVELAFLRRDTGIQIDAVQGGAAVVLGSSAAPSVTAAVNEIVLQLTRELGASLPDLGPTEREAAAMQRLGATTFGGFRGYRAILEAYLTSNWVDAPALLARTDQLLAADPTWAHLYALRANLDGQWVRSTIEQLAAGRAAIDRTRDPSGAKLLEALSLSAGSDHDSAADLLIDVFRDNEEDLLAGAELMVAATLVQRTHETIAVARRLHELYPDLLFGMDLVSLFMRAGRPAEAEALVREWVAAAPDNLVAAVELIRIEAGAGRSAEAERHARNLLLIHGEREDAMTDLFEALVLTHNLADARRIAERMLISTPLNRARGRYRLAVAGVLEGRFAAAYDALRKAVKEYRPFGFQSELSQCLELLRGIAPLVGDRAAHRRYTAELIDVYRDLIRDPVSAVATGFELSLIDGGETPLIEALLEPIEDGPSRDLARRRMLRAAAVAGRGSPVDAVAAGFSADEGNPASLVALGICARGAGELGLAQRSLECATRLWSSSLTNQSSAYAAVLAQFHLAGVLADQGQAERSRALYETFLGHWGEADRPVPEVAVARQAVMLGSRA